VRVLFVCTGNICRSPMAEALTRHLAQERGLAVEVDSAGTDAWHVGEPPHPGALAALSRRGIRLERRARQVGPEDAERFDLLVALDRGHARILRRRFPHAAAKVRLLSEFGPPGTLPDVPDPYYDGQHEAVCELVERCCRGLVDWLARVSR
jgi:protein-tyrosine phosphatase